MDIDYWNRFLRTGSVEDYLQYRQCISTAGQEVINGKSDQNSKRNSVEGNSIKRER